MRHVSFTTTSPVIFNLAVTFMMKLILLTGIPHQITLVKPWNYNASRNNLTLILVSIKGQKRDKSKFVTKFIGIIVTIFIKISPKFLIKFLLQCFFTHSLISWVAHITRDYLWSYSCSYYSSMVKHKFLYFVPKESKINHLD